MTRSERFQYRSTKYKIVFTPSLAAAGIFVHDSQPTSPAMSWGRCPSLTGDVGDSVLRPAAPSSSVRWSRPPLHERRLVSETVRGRWFGHVGQNLTTAANELDSVLGNALGLDLTARLLTVAITSSSHRPHLRSASSLASPYLQPQCARTPRRVVSRSVCLLRVDVVPGPRQCAAESSSDEPVGPSLGNHR
jgi:hypothetical protein